MFLCSLHANRSSWQHTLLDELSTSIIFFKDVKKYARVISQDRRDDHQAEGQYSSFELLQICMKKKHSACTPTLQCLAHEDK